MSIVTDIGVEVKKLRRGRARSNVGHAGGARGADWVPASDVKTEEPHDLSLEVRVRAVGYSTRPGTSIDVDPVEPSDARFTISPWGMQSKLLQRAGNVAGQLREHTAA